jgi:phosphoserine phosphatase RsbU/P
MNDGFPEPNLARIGAPEILDALADGAYITDRSRKIVFWSRAAERITGWPAKEVVGHNCSENLLVHTDKDGHQLCGFEHCPLHRAIQTGELSSEPLLVFAQHKGGHRVPVEVSVAPLRNGEGTIIGGIEVFRDLTTVLDDLRRARVIQQHALASELPRDDRLRIAVSYSPEELVGGDFYRVERTSPDAYVFMVADVMGHGVASALYTMQLRSLWEECRESVSDPARFLEAFNRKLFKLTSGEGYFATAVFLLLNLASGSLDYIRAGHPSPFLFRKRGTVERLPEFCPALGLEENVDYVTAKIEFACGDSLLAFTDGAVEIPNAEDQELGEDGLLRIVQNLDPAQFDLQEIERKLLEHTRRLRLPDDLTLLSVARL